MRRTLRLMAWSLAGLVLLASMALTLYLRSKAPQREGTLDLPGLSHAVSVRYDEAGVPHISAANEADLYRALGYVHAQDRLFQMEMVRRLARGELAEVLGPKLVDTDRLMRTLRIREHADAQAIRFQGQSNPRDPASQALLAYLDGVNHCVAHCPLPLEFELLGLPRRTFAPADTFSVIGYLAYSFASALRSDPALTHVRDQLGPDYLRIFELNWHPEGALQADPRQPQRAPTALAAAPRPAPLSAADTQALARLGELSLSPLALAQQPLLEGSNAWVMGAGLTASGKPLLAGDPHIGFAVPAVWFEAHLQAPGFELYGQFNALIPMALLGHNSQFAWSLTMFQNDDMDLVAEHTDPQHPGAVWHQGQWVALESHETLIAVKGAEPVKLTLRRSPHGPLVNDALPPGTAPSQPLALWWALLETENPLLQAFYQLNRADTLAAARQAAAQVHAPGLNILWANAAGDIAWWAAAQLPRRPAGVLPNFILDARRGEADKPGFRPFTDNPQEENPVRGYIVSANHQPASPWPLPGYYAPADRVQRLDQDLRRPDTAWTTELTAEVQTGTANAYPRRLAAGLLAALKAPGQPPLPADEQALLEQLGRWGGDHATTRVEPTLFYQWLYEVLQATLADEMGPALMPLLLKSRALDDAVPRLLADADSPWWDRRDTPDRETRATIVRGAWQASLAHLRQTLGQDPSQWTWGRAHTLTHKHPLGRQAPLDRLLNVGPLPVPGGREMTNNFTFNLGPAPWAVTSGPSTRRIIDLGQPDQAWVSNPVGQSGVWGDAHYADQAQAHAQGRYRRAHLAPADVERHTASQLTLQPAP